MYRVFPFVCDGGNRGSVRREAAEQTGHYKTTLFLGETRGRLNSPSVCNGDEPKSGLARDLGDRLQFRDVPFYTSGDFTAGISEAFLRSQPR